MIQKIKDLMKTKEDLDAINQNVEENNRIISELKEELKSLKTGLKETKKSQDEFLNTFKDNLSSISNLKEDFGKELYDFKLLKGQLQRKILDKFEEELQKDLEVNRDSLKKDIQDYNELKKNVDEILSRINMTSTELSKFLDISRNIKKEDVELVRHSRNLAEMDREKLELMRKVDNLERMLSKMRRREI